MQFRPRLGSPPYLTRRAPRTQVGVEAGAQVVLRLPPPKLGAPWRLPPLLGALLGLAAPEGGPPPSFESLGTFAVRAAPLL